MVITMIHNYILPSEVIKHYFLSYYHRSIHTNSYTYYSTNPNLLFKDRLKSDDSLITFLNSPDSRLILEDTLIIYPNDIQRTFILNKLIGPSFAYWRPRSVTSLEEIRGRKFSFIIFYNIIDMSDTIDYSHLLLKHKHYILWGVYL